MSIQDIGTVKKTGRQTGRKPGQNLRKNPGKNPGTQPGRDADRPALRAGVKTSRGQAAALDGAILAPSGDEAAILLERYTPAYFTFIANKLARGASAHYLDVYGVGIETWRVLVMLAIEHQVTAQRVVQLIGMDKASVSRAFKSMHAQGLIRFESDDHDGRLRYASFTPKGRALHDRIMRFALERERVFLSVLEPREIDVLVDLLRRLHGNLPAVELASELFAAAEKRLLGPEDGAQPAGVAASAGPLE